MLWWMVRHVIMSRGVLNISTYALAETHLTYQINVCMHICMHVCMHLTYQIVYSPLTWSNQVLQVTRIYKKSAECKLIFTHTIRTPLLQHSHNKAEGTPVVITMEVLETYYDMPLLHAAHKLGICATALKKASQAMGVSTFPPCCSQMLSIPFVLVQQYFEGMVVCVAAQLAHCCSYVVVMPAQSVAVCCSYAWSPAVATARCSVASMLKFVQVPQVLKACCSSTQLKLKMRTPRCCHATCSWTIPYNQQKYSQLSRSLIWQRFQILRVASCRLGVAGLQKAGRAEVAIQGLPVHHHASCAKLRARMPLN